MGKVLICPGERAAVGFLAQSVPLVAVPVLGETLLTYWAESLANSGAKEIRVLATDRPELVRATLGDGSRWGVRIQVQPELKELAPAEACEKLRREGGDWQGLSGADVTVLDHLPGLPELPMFRSYRDWFAAVLAWMPQSATLSRIGLHELRPQVWCGRRTSLAPSARVHPPCWLGDHVRVAADAVIGPNTILEDRVVVDSASEIEGSVIGPDTYVGALTKIENSLAWGSTLIDWRTGSCTQVPDPFLLCSLGQRYASKPGREPESRGRRAWWTVLTRPRAWMSEMQGKFRQ